ncbi:MAG: hypothetical protein QW607_01590 [Desulfurococcaceae archaeon]
MPVMTLTRIGEYHRTIISMEIHKLLELRENNEIELTLENGVVYVRNVCGEDGELSR